MNHELRTMSYELKIRFGEFYYQHLTNQKRLYNKDLPREIVKRYLSGAYSAAQYTTRQIPTMTRSC